MSTAKCKGNFSRDVPSTYKAANAFEAEACQGMVRHLRHATPQTEEFFLFLRGAAHSIHTAHKEENSSGLPHFDLPTRDGSDCGSIWGMQLGSVHRLHSRGEACATPSLACLCLMCILGLMRTVIIDRLSQWRYTRLWTTVCLAGWVHCCTAPIPLRVLVVTTLLCFTTPECPHVHFWAIFITFSLQNFKCLFLSLTILRSTTLNYSRLAIFSPTPFILGSFERYFSAV